MAAGAWVIFDNFKATIGKSCNLASDTVKMTLHTSTYTPTASGDSVYADLSNELSTANGYTNGGATLASQAYTQTSGTGKFTSDPVSWTASGGSIVARYAVMRLVGTFDTQVDPLIAYCLLDSTPADVTASAGNPLTVTPHANGYFSLA